MEKEQQESEGKKSSPISKTLTSPTQFTTKSRPISSSSSNSSPNKSPAKSPSKSPVKSPAKSPAKSPSALANFKKRKSTEEDDLYSKYVDDSNSSQRSASSSFQREGYDDDNDDDDGDEYEDSNDDSDDDNQKSPFKKGNSSNNNNNKGRRAFSNYNANQIKYWQQLSKINTDSEDFKKLPAEVQHEILVEVKEYRRKTAWSRFGKLREKASTGNSFSDFQVKNLLKKNTITQRMESLQKVMMTSSVVLDPNTFTRRIAAEAGTEYILRKGNDFIFSCISW